MKTRVILSLFLAAFVSLTGCKPETTVNLDALPQGVTLPADSPVRYDAAQKKLIVKGELNREKRNQLLALSGDMFYKKAINKLFEWTYKDESAISGHISFVADVALQNLAKVGVMNFSRGREQTEIDLFTEPSEKIVSQLLNEEIRFAIKLGDLTEKEQAELAKKTFALIRKRFAKDAVCLIVHPSNMVADLRVSQVAELLSGKAASWSAVGGKDVPVKIFLPLEQDGRRTMLKDSLRISVFGASAKTCVTENQISEEVSLNPGSIGVVSMSTAKPFLALKTSSRDTSKFKVIAVRADEHSAEAYLPFQGYVAQNLYPLSFDIMAIYRSDLGLLPTTFASFLFSGNPDQGQSLLMDMGLVPTQVQIQLKQ
jgi:phosphate transport system substrate-binding protein